MLIQRRPPANRDTAHLAGEQGGASAIPFRDEAAKIGERCRPRLTVDDARSGELRKHRLRPLEVGGRQML